MSAVNTNSSIYQDMSRFLGEGNLTLESCFEPTGETDEKKRMEMHASSIMSLLKITKDDLAKNARSEGHFGCLLAFFRFVKANSLEETYKNFVNFLKTSSSFQKQELGFAQGSADVLKLFCEEEVAVDLDGQRAQVQRLIADFFFPVSSEGPVVFSDQDHRPFLRSGEGLIWFEVLFFSLYILSVCIEKQSLGVERGSKVMDWLYVKLNVKETGMKTQLKLAFMFSGSMKIEGIQHRVRYFMFCLFNSLNPGKRVRSVQKRVATDSDDTERVAKKGKDSSERTETEMTIVELNKEFQKVQEEKSRLLQQINQLKGEMLDLLEDSVMLRFSMDISSK
jgi:hypothetical protein